MSGGSPARHIALFVSSLPEGAIQQVLVNLANGFFARGHRVDLVAARFEGKRPADLHPDVRSVDLAAVSTRIPWVRGRRRRWLPASAPELAQFLKRERPDGLLCGGNYANLAGLWARQLSGVSTRVTLSEHNPISDAVSNPGRVKLFLPSLVRRFYPKADGIVAVSGSVADDLAKFSRIPRDRIAAIWNPVLTPSLLGRMAESPEHPEWVDGDSPVVVTAARLAPQKDLETLLQAFALLRARRQARLLVLGEGRSRPTLERSVRDLGLADDVRMPGRITNPLPYLRRSAAFALSSIYEGFGNVLVEALAAGCPVVSTDCPGGPGEILERGRYGRLVPVGDPAALARGLEDALDSPPDPASLKRRAQDFSTERIAQAYLDLPLT